MFHTVLYGNTPAGAETLTAQPIIPTGADTVQNNAFFPVQDMDLLVALAFGTTTTQRQVSTATLRGVAPYEIRALNLGAVPVTDANADDLTDNPVRLRASENINILDSDTTGTTKNWTMLWLGISKQTNAKGPRYRTRAIATTTLTANAWTTIVPTYDVNLPAGLYEVQNFEAISATGILARLVLSGNPWRPGTLCQSTLGKRLPLPLYLRHVGPWGQFSTLAYPNVEIYATAADTAQTFFFDLVKIA